MAICIINILLFVFNTIIANFFINIFDLFNNGLNFINNIKLIYKFFLYKQYIEMAKF